MPAGASRACGWSEALGAPRRGFHAARMPGTATAAGDFLGTVALSWALAAATGTRCTPWALALLASAEALHWLLCVDVGHGRG